MSEAGGSAHVAYRPPASAESLGFVLLAALLIGGGLFAVSTWILTMNWLWFLGFGPLLFGGLLLFSPRTGPDRAE